MTLTLADLGWSPFFQRQLDNDLPADLTPMRVSQIHRDRLTALGPDGEAMLITPHNVPTGDYAVGDWVLADDENRAAERLDRQTLLSRRAAGTDARVQLIAANVDTLFITSSCNADFNIARLERYLALAHEAGCFPVLVLTKADMAEDPGDYVRRAQALSPALPVLAVNALDPDDLHEVAAWCKHGQTAVLVGSSGVGKSTLMNSLTHSHAVTAAIREDDARGRHTTTARSLWRMNNGGWIIDTPGIRALRLHDVAEGLESLFADLIALTPQCKFSDCSHTSEPGCAITAAVEAGEIDAKRVARWQKLAEEDARNSETLAQARARSRKFGKMIHSFQKEAKARKGR